MRKHHVYADEFSLNEAQCRYDAKADGHRGKDLFSLCCVSKKRESPRATIIEFDDTGAQLCWHCRISLAYNAKKYFSNMPPRVEQNYQPQSGALGKRTVKLARF